MVIHEEKRKQFAVKVAPMNTFVKHRLLCIGLGRHIYGRVDSGMSHKSLSLPGGPN